MPPPPRDENRVPAPGPRPDRDPDHLVMSTGGPGAFRPQAASDGPAGTPPPTILPGQILLDQYLVKRKLGEGGMGSVWLVEDRVLKTDRALKLIKPVFAADPAARARFQREAQVMARVRHENAVLVHTAQLVGQTAAIVMEYIQGESLDRLLKPGQSMSLDWVARAVEQLCAVLHVAHEQGIVHRDLKPSNLMLVAGRPTGEVFLKVLDFGLAKILEGEAPDSTLSGSMAWFGTYPYMSPEQVNCEPVSPRSDLYAVGIILYELLTGRRPFEGSQYQVLTDHMNKPPPPFHEKAPGCRVPPEVERVVMRCLEKSPDRRPASARALAEAFRTAAAPSLRPSPAPKTEPFPPPRPKAVLHPPPPPTEPATPVPPRPRPGRYGVWGGGLAVVAVVLILAAYSLGGPSTRDTTFRFDLPVDGLAVTIDGKAVDVSRPVTLATGRPHHLVAVQGDFTAADTPFTVSAATADPVAVSLKRRERLRIEPKPDTVLVDESPRAVDEDGTVTVVFNGPDRPHLWAKARGYKDLDRRLTHDEAARQSFLFRLDSDVNQLARDARAVLKRHCYACHGVDFTTPALDVLDRDALTTLRATGGRSYLVPGNPAESVLWTQVDTGRMPPRDTLQGPPPSPEEKATLKAWIEAGAPAGVETSRRFLTAASVVEAIRADTAKAREASGRFFRYFTLTHLFNDPAVLDEDLQLYRLGLLKAVNSLNREKALVDLQAIDSDATVYRIDLRQTNWRENGWGRVYLDYPYGLQQFGTEQQPGIRADWFVATATRPPLYHDLLELPETAVDLESQVARVNVAQDVEAGRVERAGVKESGVSPANRVVERHGGRDTVYWKTYDFRKSQPRSDVVLFPLGPPFEGNPFAAQAFRPAGSAMIFRLENGFFGYMLADAQGLRIDEAPLDVLADRHLTSGSPVVVNGLSCLGCHRLGVKPAADVVRDEEADLPKDARAKVEQIYPPPDDLADTVRRDQQVFARVWGNATRAVTFPAGSPPVPSLEEQPEPVGYVARRLRADLRPAGVASELGLDGVDSLRKQVEALPEPLRSALAPLLAPNGSIPRAAWEAAPAGRRESLFQCVSEAMGLGRPYHEPRASARRRSDAG